LVLAGIEIRKEFREVENFLIISGKALKSTETGEE
jgi:hypothetical protein